MTDEERVRQLAYSIWEAEGRPEGQQQRHWDRALKIVATEQVAGNDADLEEVGEPIDETPILEDDLPLEEDEIGIQENRLPLEDPESDPYLDAEVPFQEEALTGEDMPDEDIPVDEVPVDDVLFDEVTGEDVPVQDRGHPTQTPADPVDTASPMEPLPEESATVARTRRPRRSSDPLATAEEPSTSKKAGKTATAKKTDAKTAKKTTPKAKKTKTTKTSDRS